MFLEITGGILALALSIYFIFYILNSHRFDLAKTETKVLLNRFGQIIEHGKHWSFKTPKQTYEVIFQYVPALAELTINSKTKWEIKTNNRSEIKDMTHTFASDHEKLVIVFPTEIKIKRYINENEMVFVEPEHRFNQMHVILKKDLENSLKRGAL